MGFSVKKREEVLKRYNQDLAESISMVIKDETGDGKRRSNAIEESIDEGSIDSFEEYLGSKFGTSMVKSGIQGSKSGIGINKSIVTENISKKIQT